MLPSSRFTMPAKVQTAASKMKAYRNRLRSQGLRPVQIWVPDIDAPGFRNEVRRQIRRLNAGHEAESLAFIAAVAEESPR
jgi:hypothetical protein